MIRFTAEQEEFRKTVARFVDAEVVPVADALDERAEFPAGLFKRIGELGYFGLRYPEKYGGGGGDMGTYCLFAQELAPGSMSGAAGPGMQSPMGAVFIFKERRGGPGRGSPGAPLRGGLLSPVAR